MPRANHSSSITGPNVDGDRRDTYLEQLIDLCTSAKTIADAQDEKFLSYMLAMTIQAARGLLRARGTA